MVYKPGSRQVFKQILQNDIFLKFKFISAVRNHRFGLLLWGKWLDGIDHTAGLDTKQLQATSSFQMRNWIGKCQTPSSASQRQTSKWWVTRAGFGQNNIIWRMWLIFALCVLDLTCKYYIKNFKAAYFTISFFILKTEYKCKANCALSCSVNEISNFPHSQQPIHQMQQLRLKGSATSTQTQNIPYPIWHWSCRVW